MDATITYVRRERTLTAWPVRDSFRERWPNTYAEERRQWVRESYTAAYRIARGVLRANGVQSPNSLAALIAKNMMQELGK